MILDAINNGGKRRELDYYQTPPAATRALLPLIANWPSEVWEPACGDGAISKILETAGFVVQSADIVDRGYGEVQDFFEVKSPWQSSIVTNPPFDRAHDFIRHAHSIGVQRMALLLKATFFSSKRGSVTLDIWPPRLIAQLTWRLDFTGAGAPHTDCQWVLWDGPACETKFLLLQRPAEAKAA